MTPALGVRVACSTSNLGPGFDQLGLGLDLWLEARLEADDRGGSGPRVVLQGELDAPDGRWPAASDDVLLRALRVAAGSERDLSGLRIRVRSAIPVGRGLGSSGAAVAAGLLLGYAHRNEGVQPGPEALDRLLALGCAIEGHPDNVTASLLGGLTLCVPRDGAAPMWIRRRVHPRLAFPVAWPAMPLETSRARAALPREVALADAVENARRLPQLLDGLEHGDGERIAFGLEDRLHVRHRLPLLPGAREALAAAGDAGAFGATISGSGSALVAVSEREHAPEVSRAMGDALRRATGRAEAVALEPVLEAPRVARL